MYLTIYITKSIRIVLSQTKTLESVNIEKYGMLLHDIREIKTEICYSKSKSLPHSILGSVM